MRFIPAVYSKSGGSLPRTDARAKADFIRQHVRHGWTESDAAARYELWTAGAIDMNPDLDVNSHRELADRAISLAHNSSRAQDEKNEEPRMTDTHASSQSLRYGWGSLWRAHTSLPREIASAEFTVFVRAIGREEAHAAMGRVILAMYPNADLEYAYYNLTSARELVEQGVSHRENDRLFETGWHGTQVESWVDMPVFAVPDAAELFLAWTKARQAGA
ncbi:hypothetical protein [Burkholderia gladioli]|uniref:hypothetical protein n=1 Tax=Burkholderia gladioli TaxID=28095 RepID=UPI001FC82BD6|nr:hypothetical protein [Burkholderia gladioli]